MSTQFEHKKHTQHQAPEPKTFVLVLAVILVGSALVVLNSDDIYLHNKNSATLSVPEQFLSGTEGSLIIQAADTDGEPASDKEVTISLTRGDVSYQLWKGTTDDEGIAQPSFLIPEELGEATLHIDIGSESFKKDVEIVSSYRIIISTDKPLYQPGQTIHIRTLAYQGTNPQASDSDVKLEVQDPDGNKIFRKVLPANEYGIASYDFVLSDQLPLGNYKLSATIENTTTEKTVSVQKYVLPKYRIGFEDIKSWYLVDDTLTGTINASYVFGEPITGNVKLEAKTYYGEWETIATKEGELQDGLFDFSISLDSYYFVGLDINKGNAYLELNATITDTSGHVEEKSKMVTITQSPIMLMSMGDTNIHGKESTYYFIARYPDGKAVPDAELTITLQGYNYDGERVHTLYTDQRGVAPFTFLYDKNINRVEITAEKDGQVSLTYYINLRGQEEGLKVLSDEVSYTMGEKARCDVFYSGTGGTNIVFYDLVSGGFVVQSGRTELSNGTASIEFTMRPDMIPMVDCRVYKIQKDLTVLMDSVILSVGQEEPLDVKISPDKESYRPGGDVGLNFHVRDDSGNDVASALGITIVDLSVFELQERFTGYEEIYFSLEQEFTEPQYQILSYIFGTGNALPSSTSEHVEKESLDFGVRVYQSGGAHDDDAETARDGTIAKSIQFFVLAAMLGYLSLFLLAAKYKITRPVMLSLIVVVSLVLPMGFVLSHLWSESDDDIGTDGVHDLDEEAGFAGGERFGGGGAGGGWEDLNGDAMAGEKNGAPSGDGSSSQGSGDEKTVQEPEHVRKNFPETWVWEPSLITDEHGQAALTLIAPDTITTWRVDAVASTKDAKMGVGSANITVFQEFFVEPDIPVEVVRNDEFPLNIMVYNYHSEDQEITLKLENDSWFELLSDDFYQTVDLAPASVAGVDYRIKAKEVGIFNITITASSLLMADKVIRPMTVVPDGQRIQHIINGELTDNVTVNETVELSLDRIKNSENAYLKLQGSMGAVTVEGAEEYIHFVSGCGEQSMSTLSIDILAYAIVKESGSSEKLFEYEMITTQGIQHELTFLMDAKNGEGRGIVWFPSDQDVHPWLTSWGLLTFQDALDAGFVIDDAIITDMQSYLISQQKKDGSFQFPERGLYETTNQILRSKVVATTAYITRALLYSGYEPDSHIKDAMSYIESNIKDHWDDAYTLAVSLIVLEDGGGKTSLRNEVAGRLVELKKEDNGTYYWNSDTNMIGSSQQRWWGGSSSNTIETTAYAVMALSKHGDTASASKGVKYLLTHRIGGGFFSTQDTVVAFQALTRWGEVSVKELSVDIYLNDALVETQTVTEENADLTYLIDLRPWINDTNQVRLVSSGEGSLLYQVYMEEYIPWEEQQDEGELTLDVSYDSTNIAVNDAITATLTLDYQGTAPQLKMVLVDLRAPVGFAFNEDEFAEMVEGGTISHYELTGRQLLLYLSDIEAGKDYSYVYTLTAEKPIKATLQGVNAYDMYNPLLKDVEQPVEITSY